MKTISLAKAANDLPVTGTIYTGKKQPWLHGTTYSSYAIWSVQVSPITGTVFGMHYFCDVIKMDLVSFRKNWVLINLQVVYYEKYGVA